uniref:Serine/threonine-protein phosphatase n=1 Tax=Ascaris lumbricoides TaxID=6252 RepID=A0A0M3IC96_ASCLU
MGKKRSFFYDQARYTAASRCSPRRLAYTALKFAHIQASPKKLADARDDIKKKETTSELCKRYKEPSERVQEIIDYLLMTNVTDITVKEKEIFEVCYRVREQLMKDESMLDIEAPIVLVGDVHGQYEDLIGIFEMNGYPPKQRFLFLGDYVDRGKNSIETTLLLFCYKLLHPQQIFLLRGNHETRLINRVYGFYEECENRYSKALWQIFQSVFNCLPLCARISNRIFCMHGGISNEIVSWKAMKKIRRPLEIPDYGVLCDLLWADPDSSVSKEMAASLSQRRLVGLRKDVCRSPEGRRSSHCLP